ncbi:hypothetical protein BDZ91DRAFT_542006 [Kalaharituber pfeilii]|nr:hypothetical protein BDZ91DRAFT_542006 [Kalaharituber pfeilii]
MVSLLARPSRDSGLQDEDSHTGKTDEEEDWARTGDGGGGGVMEAVLGVNLEDTVRPILLAWSQLSKRRLYWHQPRQDVPDLQTLISESISATVSTIPDPTDLPPVVTSQAQTPSPSTLWTSFVSSAPTSTTDVENTSRRETTDALVHTTIISTISNFAPNGTGGDLSRAPITSGGTVIVFTTPAVRNKTTILSVLTTSSSANSTTTATELSTGLLTTTFAVYNPYPEATVTEHTPPAPSNTDMASDSADDTPPVEPRLLGGIFGGLAGIALILLGIFMLLKRHKKQRTLQALDDAGYGGPLPTPSMVQRSISILGRPFIAKCHSETSDPEPAERGFVKVSGRKLPPAIGGSRPEFDSMKSNAQSSYLTGDDSGIGASGTSKSSHGVARHSTTSTVQASNPFISPPSSPVGPGPSRLRETSDTISIEESSPPPPKSPPPRPYFNRQLSLQGTDGVGRSLASHDGSRGSRFTEDIT